LWPAGRRKNVVWIFTTKEAGKAWGKDKEIFDAGYIVRTYSFCK
jgi:hypothetical protein